MQRSIYRQRNWNDASSDFIEKACLHMSITAHHIFFIRYQPKALFFLPNVQFHFAWGLKLKILRNFFIVCFQRKQKEMKASLQYKTKPFLGRGKTSTLFSGESYSYVVKGKVLGHKRCGTWPQFCESVVFFPYKSSTFLFGKAYFWGMTSKF